MKINYNAPFTLTFTFIAVLIFGLNQINGVDINTYLATPARFSSLHNPYSFLGIFFHPLAHANYEHISSNLMLFMLISPMLEEKYGSLKMLELSLITAFVTSLLNMLLFPNMVLIGASGIIFMMIVLSSFTGNKGNGIPLTMIFIILVYLGKEVAASFEKDSIAQSAHIIGGLMGAFFGLFFIKPKTSKINPKNVEFRNLKD